MVAIGPMRLIERCSEENKTFKAEIDESGMIHFSGEEMTITESEGGIYTAVIPITKTEKAGEVETQDLAIGSITFTLYGYVNNIQNLYEITYLVTANELVNGIVGDLSIKSTSILSPETYYSKHISKTFPASTIYYGDVGNVVIPFEIKKVRLSFKNSKIYFLSTGWTPGINLTSVHDVN